MNTIEKYLKEESEFKGLKFKRIETADKDKFRSIIFKDGEGKEHVVAKLQTGLTHNIFQAVIKMIGKAIGPY